MFAWHSQATTRKWPLNVLLLCVRLLLFFFFFQSSYSLFFFGALFASSVENSTTLLLKTRFNWAMTPWLRFIICLHVSKWAYELMQLVAVAKWTPSKKKYFFFCNRKFKIRYHRAHNLVSCMPEYGCVWHKNTNIAKTTIDCHFWPNDFFPLSQIHFRSINFIALFSFMYLQATNSINSY